MQTTMYKIDIQQGPTSLHYKEEEREDGYVHIPGMLIGRVTYLVVASILIDIRQSYQLREGERSLGTMGKIWSNCEEQEDEPTRKLNVSAQC